MITVCLLGGGAALCYLIAELIPGDLEIEIISCRRSRARPAAMRIGAPINHRTLFEAISPAALILIATYIEKRLFAQKNPVIPVAAGQPTSGDVMDDMKFFHGAKWAIPLGVLLWTVFIWVIWQLYKLLF